MNSAGAVKAEQSISNTDTAREGVGGWGGGVRGAFPKDQPAQHEPFAWLVWQNWGLKGLAYATTWDLAGAFGRAKHLC